MCVCVCSSCYCCISLTDMAGKPSILFKFRRLMVFAHFSFIPPRCLSTIYFYGIRTTIKHEEWSTAVFNILNICFPWYMNSKYCKWMLNMKYVWSWSYWALHFFSTWCYCCFYFFEMKQKYFCILRWDWHYSWIFDKFSSANLLTAIFYVYNCSLWQKNILFRSRLCMTNRFGLFLYSFVPINKKILVINHWVFWC